MTKEYDLPPSQQTARAALESIGLSLDALDIEPLHASYSNYTHRISGHDAFGELHQIVMRRYKVFGDYDRGAKARREFAVLHELFKQQVPAPTPLFLDDSGDILEIPGLLMDFVEGRQEETPADEAAYGAELARTLARIHQIPCAEFQKGVLLEGDSELTWFLRAGEPPEPMLAHPLGARIWETCDRLYDEPEPVTPRLVHVDFWSGNILWKDAKISAVLDWEEAACGDPGSDVGYALLDLIMLGLNDAADVFLETYSQAVGGQPPNLALWQLAAAARALYQGDDYYSTPARAARFSAFLDSAFARAG